MIKEKNYDLVHLGLSSQLKTDLNLGIASLQNAEESCFQPHLCLNRKEGVEILQKISRNPENANTEIWLCERLIVSGENAWLNVQFQVFLDKISFPNDAVALSPRQTGYVVKNLPADSQEIVVEKIKAWYLERFLTNLNKAFQTITEQFDSGEVFIESEHQNRIFDIHGDQGSDLPYTEAGLVGEQLFSPIFNGVTYFDNGWDGFARADQFLEETDKTRSRAADSLFNLVRAFH